MSSGSDDISSEDVSEKTAKVSYLYFFVLIAFGLLSFRLFGLQLISGDYYYNLSKGNRIRYEIVRAPRGIIYDKAGVALVKNVANFQVVIQPFDLPKDDNIRAALYSALSTDLEIPMEELSKIVPATENDIFLSPKIIKEGLDQETAIKIKMKYQDYSAISIEASPTREYLNKDFSHILGYIGRISENEYKEKQSVYDVNDYTGKNGLELSYEDYLRGTNGKQMVEVDAQGRVVRTLGTQEQLEPKMGNNIITTIDAGLEQEMALALADSMNASGSKGGSAVAIDPRTGYVLGMVTLPSFDNNLFSRGIDQKQYSALLNDPAKPLFNRTVSGTFPSGSVIKPVIASGALQEAIIDKNFSIPDHGFLEITNQYDPSIKYVFKDWKPGGHGTVNVTTAIAQSCDIFFYYMGGGYEKFPGLGAERLEKYLRLYGLGSKTNIDLPNENEGLVPTPAWKKETKNEGWYLADNYHLAIGQGDLLVTPLQAASWTATVANGRTIYKPQIVKTVKNQAGDTVKDFTPQAIRSGFISPENMQIVREGMRQTAVSGTARSFSSLPFSSGAKTGTAQYGPNNSKTHAWFTAFAPFETPEIAVAVLVEGAGEGSTFGLPVARRVLEYYMSHR